jgi:hypothetical protein
MATKRKRKRAKRKTPTTKRRTHRRKKASNPTRRRTHRRRRAHNPTRRRRARRAHARAHNPTHRRRRHRSNPTHRRRRTHRRNPAGPIAQAAIGLALGAAAFVLTDVITFYATADMAKDGQRNRKIIGALGIAGGLYLSRKHPLLGLGLAAGGLLSGFGNMIMLEVLKVLPAKAGGVAPLSGLGAVAYDNMRGIGAVAYDNLAGMQLEMGEGRRLGAVAYDNMQGWEAMGDPVPAAPWQSDNPF